LQTAAAASASPPSAPDSGFPNPAAGAAFSSDPSQPHVQQLNAATQQPQPHCAPHAGEGAPAAMRTTSRKQLTGPGCGGWDSSSPSAASTRLCQGVSAMPTMCSGSSQVLSQRQAAGGFTVSAAWHVCMAAAAARSCQRGPRAVCRTRLLSAQCRRATGSSGGMRAGPARPLLGLAARQLLSRGQLHLPAALACCASTAWGTQA